MDEKQKDQVRSLIYTSADDMKRGLWGYTDVTVLCAALRTAKRRGEKTRANMLAAHIKKLKKANAKVESDPGVCSLGYDMKN